MDDGEIGISDIGVLQIPGPCSTSCVAGAGAGESFVDEVSKNTRSCTHTHSCNPPGPHSSHTHTCFHSHTHLMNQKQSNLRPSGNREAVRKYREKKKAHTAYLEEEVKKLLLLNQQLVKKLQGKASLEAEALRLRRILIDLGGKIDIELGDFPLQRRSNSATTFEQGDCPVHPHTGSSSQGSVGGSSKVAVPWDGNCPSSRNDIFKDIVDTLVSDSSQAQ